MKKMRCLTLAWLISGSVFSRTRFRNTMPSVDFSQIVQFYKQMCFAQRILRLFFLRLTDKVHRLYFEEVPIRPDKLADCFIALRTHR